jgi:hypothetical protein
MKEGMLVRVHPDTALLELGMQQLEVIGLLLSKETWVMDSETGTTAPMWKVLIGGEEHILNEFSIEEYNELSK